MKLKLQHLYFYIQLIGSNHIYMMQGARQRKISNSDNKPLQLPSVNLIPLHHLSPNLLLLITQSETDETPNVTSLKETNMYNKKWYSGGVATHLFPGRVHPG